MKVKIINVLIQNFQAIKELKLDFSNYNLISGKNGVGKTSIMDSILWCLTGMNSRNEADSNFIINPLDLENKEIITAEPYVRIDLQIDDEIIQFARKYKKHIKKRGSNKGAIIRTREYFIEGISVQKNEYESKLEKLIGTRDQFQTLTNVTHFLKNLQWEEQRKILLEFVPALTYEKVCEFDDRFLALPKLEDFDYKTLVNHTRESIRKTESDINSNNTRIDESMYQKSKIVLDSYIDYGSLVNYKYKFKDSIEKMEKAQNKYIENQDFINNTNADISKLETNISNGETNIDFKIRTKINNIKEKISQKTDELHIKENELDKLRNHYSIIFKDFKAIDSIVNEELKNMIVELELDHEFKINESDNLRKDAIEKIESALATRIGNLKEGMSSIDKTCPLCLSEISDKELQKKKNLIQNTIIKKEKNIKTMIDSSNKYFDARVETLKKNHKDKIENAHGSFSIKERKQELKDELNSSQMHGHKLSEDISKIKKELIELEDALSINECPNAEKYNTESLNKKRATLEELKKQLEGFPKLEDIDTKTLNVFKKELEAVKSKLLNYESIKTFENRISELKDENQNLLISLEQLNQKMSLLHEYIKIKTKIMKRELETHFKSIKFKFIKYTNDGIPKETFKILINGVDHTNANPAALIIAGLEIIMFLQEKQNIYLPIILDNVETVVNKMPKVKTQAIYIKAVKNQDLQIEKMKEEIFNVIFS